MRARKLIRLLSLAIPVAIGIAVVVIAVPRLGGQADQAAAQDGIVVSLDMDAWGGSAPCSPINPWAMYMPGQSYRVAICVSNLSLGNRIGVIVFDVLYDDTKNSAPEVADIGQGLDDNPNLNDNEYGDGVGSGWDCSGGGTAYPKGDRDPETGPGNGDAYLSCRSSLGPWTMGDDETSGVLAVIDFDVIASAPTTDTLTIAIGYLGYNDASEMGTCNPELTYPMTCNGGTVYDGCCGAPTATPDPVGGFAEFDRLEGRAAPVAGNTSPPTKLALATAVGGGLLLMAGAWYAGRRRAG